MKNKRIFSSVIVIALLCAFAIGVAACGDTPTIKVNDEFLGTSDPEYAVDGMSAYELIMEAYSNWCDDDGYVRREQFVFTAEIFGGVVVATRSTDLLRKVEGQRIYSQEVILGTGQDTGTKAIRYYFDGENAWDSENTDGADISINNTSGLPVQNRVLTEHLTTYDFSKSDYLSDKHNDTVYKVGDVYYCTMTLDCSEEMMNTVHKAARDEFIANTGADEEGFSIEDTADEEGFSIEDTTIDFAIAEIDGEYKFVAWRRNEDYSGKRAGIAGGVNCTQTCYSTYSYEGYEITEELPQ